MLWNSAAVGACLLPQFGSLVNGFRSRGEIKTWAKTLKKPSWNPPDWVFGPVWTSLYTGMGYASYLVWRDAGRTFGGAATLPLGLYASQLALNWAWPEIFFKRHNLRGALIDIVLLDLNVAACSYAFYQVNDMAGYLMVPYLAWLTLATSLSYRIYKDNPKQIEAKKN